jgi:hypothetical protein
MKECAPGVRIRRVSATRLGAGNEGGFRCEPNADEPRRYIGRDTLDGLPVTGPWVDGFDDCGSKTAHSGRLRLPGSGAGRR